MDSQDPTGAVASPVAAAQDAWAPAEPQTPAATPQGAEPAPAAAPTADATPQEPAIDYRAVAEALVPRVAQYEQAFGAIQQHLAAADQRQRDEAQRTAAQQRLDNVYRIAETMPPEDAQRYLRQAQEQEIAIREQALVEARQQAAAREYQIASQLAAPLYAQHLATQHQLPPEYAQRLAMLPPQQMDPYLPVLKAEYAQRVEQDKKYQALVAQFDQLQRSQQASDVAGTGAHTGGATGVPTGTTGAAAVHDGSVGDLLSIPGMAEMFGLRG